MPVKRGISQSVRVLLLLSGFGLLLAVVDLWQQGEQRYHTALLQAQQRQDALNKQLMTALTNNDSKRALAVVNAGANPNTHGDDIPTAFLIACGAIRYEGTLRRCEWMEPAGNIPLMQAMLSHGADINARNEEKRTALHIAICRNETNQTYLEELLIEHHADINAQDASGWTPLMWAVYYHKPNIVRLLLSHGADPNQKAADEETALTLADSNKLDHIVALLQKVAR